MTSAFQSQHGAPKRRWLVAFVVLPAVVAWLLLWWMGTSPSGRYFRHDDLDDSRTVLPLVLVGWVVMIAAMMLPTTAPLLAVFRKVVSARPERDRLVALVIAGYTAVWTLVGAVAIVADDVLHRLVPEPEDGATSWVMVTVLAGAGVYQFTPLKRRCLTSCRSPFVFVSQHWHGGNANWEAFRLGVAHGWFCVGCCWTLMMVMFALGMGSFGWMLALAAVMAVEKNVARAAWLGTVLGVVLLGSAVWVAVR